MKIDKTLSEDLEKLGTNGKLRRYISLMLTPKLFVYALLVGFTSILIIALSGSGEGIVINNFRIKPIPESAISGILVITTLIINKLFEKIDMIFAFFYAGSEEDPQKPKEEVKETNP